MNQTIRYKEAKKATLISIFVNFLLGVSKVIGGLVFQSHALLADGIHSFSDLLTDVMVIFASKFGSQEADKDHPYGHQRFETAATLFLAMLLILVGAGIAWDALENVLNQWHHLPEWPAIPIILVSIFSNELLFHYTRHIGSKINSDLLITNAWHHRSDAASSLVVLVALVGSLMGYHYLDALAAIVVGGMIVKMGWNYGWSSVKELVDTAVDPDSLNEIKQTIESVDGVIKMHQCRTRMMGPDVFIDVHILVDPCLTVSEGHYIAQKVHQSLIKQLKAVKDVTVHVDPEDDEISCPSLDLPSRDQLNQAFLDQLSQDFPNIQSVQLHYLDATLTLEILINSLFSDWDALNKRLASIQSNHPDIKGIKIYQARENQS